LAVLDALRKQLDELNHSGRIVDFDEFRGLLGQFPESITVRDLTTFRAIAKRQVQLRALSPAPSEAVTPEQHDQLIALWQHVDDKLAESVAAHLPPADAERLDDLLTKSDRLETLDVLVNRMGTVAQQNASRRLSGWQRLWVLFAIIWTLLMAGYVADVGVSAIDSPSDVGWWAIPPLGLYAFGWAIAWVRRGFSG
jgi:hypothetical protein